MKIRHPKFVAAIAAITAPPALVAFAWAIVNFLTLRLVLLLTMFAVMSFIIYHFILWDIKRRDEHQGKD